MLSNDKMQMNKNNNKNLKKFLNCVTINNSLLIDIKAEVSKYFESMYQTFIDIKNKKIDNVDMDILSMGMSHDYEAAIKNGSNIVRVGSAIFGARKYF